MKNGAEIRIFNFTRPSEAAGADPFFQFFFVGKTAKFENKRLNEQISLQQDRQPDRSADGREQGKENEYSKQ